MDFEENTVDTEVNEYESADDMLSDEIVEEEEEPAESLDSLTAEEEEAKPAEEQEPERQGTSEPGYVQKRIDKALARERESMRAEIMAQVEAQYAPIKERLLEMDAQDLVRKGEVKSIELARELVRLRNGQTATQETSQQKAEQPRQANGQFAAKEDPADSAKVDFLARQAVKVKASKGVDVMAVFNSDPEIRNKVLSGEMDFYEVADQMKEQPKRKPPSPTRSSNGASGQTPNAIENMTKEQFARMEKKIAEGARYSLR